MASQRVRAPSSVRRFTSAIRKLYVAAMTDRLPTMEKSVDLAAMVTELNQAFGELMEQMSTQEGANRGRT